MKYYKLTKTGGGYDSIHKGSKAFELGKIYSEDCTLGNINNVGTYAKNSAFWIKVPEIDYFVQEGKMPEYFAIKRVADNPLWQKYISWLRKKYNNFFDGTGSWYGFDGSTNYFNMFCSSLDEFKNNPVELTLEQWDQIVNKTIKEEFKLPEKWCVLSQGKDTYEKYLQPYLLKHNYENPEWNGTDYYYSYIKGEFFADNYPEIRGCVQISFEQFIKYVLKQDVMKENDKEIIGWKLKDSCEQYTIAALNIIRQDRFYIFGEGYNFSNNSTTASDLKKAGVLELWFEPVYAEEFKVGDWITIEDSNKLQPGCKGCKRRTYHIISKPMTDWCGLSEDDGGFFVKTFDEVWKISNIGVRLATPEEIKTAQIPQITINGYKGEFFDYYVKFGCAEIDREDFIQLNEFVRLFGDERLTNKYIESVTIGKGTFTKEQIKQIAEYYNKK